MSEIKTASLAGTEETLEQDDTMHGKFLVFYLDSQEYAIAIKYVVDIINVQPVTKVPNCPDFVLGITNLRGKVIPIVDVRIRFGKQPQEFNERTCIIVVEDRGASVGMIIDSVSEVITLGDDQIAPPPHASAGGADNRFLMGIGKAEDGIKLLLDCHAVLDDDLPSLDQNGAE